MRATELWAHTLRRNITEQPSWPWFDPTYLASTLVAATPRHPQPYR
ncbi:hypothetical protein [Streptomyces noursei]